MDNLHEVKNLTFRKFCMTIGNLPSAYAESMSYLELLMWFCDYLENTVIPTINNNADAVTEMQNLFTTLKSFVDNYFNNLNVQEEINNKLDEMANDGSLTNLIKNYVDPYINEQNSRINAYKTEQDTKILNFKSEQDERITQIDNNLKNIAKGSPKKSYTSVSNLIADNPDDGIYLITENGHIYSWVKNSELPVDLGSYLDAGSVQNTLDYLSDIYYKKILEYNYGITYENEGTILNLYFPFNIKKDKYYAINLKFNSVPEIYNQNQKHCIIRTTTSENTSSIVDTIEELPTVDEISNYKFVFKPTADSNFIFIRLNISNGDLDFNIFLEESLNTFVKNIEETLIENNYLAEKLVTNKQQFNYFSDDVNGIVRTFYPYNFKKNHKYLFDIYFDKFFSHINSTVSYALSSSLQEDASTRVDIITSDNKNNHRYTGEKIRINYNPTADSNFLYLYLNINNNAPFKQIANIFIDVYEIANYASNDREGMVKIGEGLQIDENGILSVASTLQNFGYTGQKINLKNNYFDCSLFKHINKPQSSNTGFQGFSIFNDLIFQLQHTGILSIYDMDTNNSTPLATCDLGSKGSNNHANLCNFSQKYYNDNTIPLLYVTGGNSGNEMRCEVENITIENNDNEYTISAEKIQTIYLDQSNFESKGFVKYWGWSAWLTSVDNKYLYYFGAKYRTNGSMSEYDDINRYIVTKFKMPELTNSSVTLTADDVLEQFTTEYPVNITQGGTLYKDKIYYVFGYGNTNYPDFLGVWNLRNKSFENLVPLAQTPLGNQEVEDCYIHNDKLFIVTASGNIYTLDF